MKTNIVEQIKQMCVVVKKLGVFKVLPLIHNKSDLYKSSRPGVLCKKAFLKKFTKCTGKHLC